MSAMSNSKSGIKFDQNKIRHFYNNDSADNPRSDGGYITLAVQVNEPVYGDKHSTGWVTIWHIMTTIPHPDLPKNDRPKQDLPMVQKDPIFVGELSMTIENDPITISKGNLPTKRSTSYAATHVPYIMIQQKYQGFRIAPIMWLYVTVVAKGNANNQINQWKAARAHGAGPGVNVIALPEPPLDVIVVDLPDSTIQSYWEKVGFNFLASQTETAWNFSDETRRDMTDIFRGIANAATVARVNPLVNILPAQIRGATDYIEQIALDGIKRGLWRATDITGK